MMSLEMLPDLMTPGHLTSNGTRKPPSQLSFFSPIDRHTTLIFGYSHLFPGVFIKESGASKAIDFLYLLIQYTF